HNPQPAYRRVFSGAHALDRIPMTREGFDTLKKELETLKKVDRPRTIRAIEEARSHGDLSENAEYDAAKDRQGFIEGRIGELEFKLAQADIIDPSKMPKDRAVFGSRVLLENIDTGETVQYQLVGPEESNIDQGRISITSPLGKAIIGKKPSDELVLTAPGGKRCYELMEIL
ncbi:MAG: transcription elongation factor GreA, partial [Desulfatirhabdiaceae bacterium]